MLTGASGQRFGKHGKHSNRSATASNFDDPIAVDPWHRCHAGRLGRHPHTQPSLRQRLRLRRRPSLPSYLALNGAVYVQVSDMGTGRIQMYALNMHPVNRDAALARVRQELPSDATVAWDLTLDECYRVTFDSATLRTAGPYMAEVQLEDIQGDGTRAPDPHRFNQASFHLDAAGSPPNPDIGC